MLRVILPNCVFTTFAFVSFVLCLIRFPMQWHAWNVGIHLYLAWVGLACLALGINSIIWNRNTVNWAPIWCDISSRLIFGTKYAPPAIILSINRRLYFLASPTSLFHSDANKGREIIIDLAIGIGLPIIGIILSFLTEDGRFMILEDYGCFPSNLHSWLSFIIITIPPIVFELIASVYGYLAIRALFKRRSQLNELLSSHENLNSTRYIRLMFFSAFHFLTGVPFTMFYLFIAIKAGLLPFSGLKQEHHHFSRIIHVPAIVWRAATISELGWELNRWNLVWSAFVFFGIFGFTAEARNNHRAALQAVVRGFTMMTGFKSRPTSSKAEEITFKAATRDLPASVDTLNFDLEPSAI